MWAAVCVKPAADAADAKRSPVSNNHLGKLFQAASGPEIIMIMKFRAALMEEVFLDGGGGGLYD